MHLNRDNCSIRGMHGEAVPHGRRRHAIAWIALIAGVLACAGCAHKQGVPVESRPTPPQPTAPNSTEVPPTSTTAKEAAPVVPPAATNARLTRIAADTTAVAIALRKCAGKNLLPDQEGVYESASRLMVEARAAIAIQDWSRAESTARQARQLAGSLSCY